MPTFNAKDYEYPELPEDAPLLCVITDIDEVPNKFKKADTDPETQLQFKFEVVEGEFKGEWITTWAAPNFGKKTKLTKIACAAFGVEELDNLDTDELIGKRLIVIGDYGEDGKAEYLRPTKFKPASPASNGTGRRGRRPTEEAAPAASAPAEAREPVGAGAVSGEKQSSDDDLDF